MSEYFLEKRDFFQLKELEKSLPKEKGIVMQSVKEVLQSLVDDRLVNAEKIGTSNYFWSFPSTAMQTVPCIPSLFLPCLRASSAEKSQDRESAERIGKAEEPPDRSPAPAPRCQLIATGRGIVTSMFCSSHRPLSVVLG